MGYWGVGEAECWSVGVLECWSVVAEVPTPASLLVGEEDHAARALRARWPPESDSPHRQAGGGLVPAARAPKDDHADERKDDA